MPTPYEEQEQQQTQQQEQQQQQPRIYQVTDGLKSQATKETYRYGFNQFISITIKNNDLRVLLETKQGVIESKIISHIEYLRDTKKLKYWSIQVYCSAILHFFEMNDYYVNTKKIKRFLPSDDPENYCGDRPYSMSEIQQILGRCDIRSRVIVLLMSSTGMRVGAIPSLRVGDIKKFDEQNLYLIWVYNNSKKDRYYTFCTTECARAIEEYMEYRKRFGEELRDKSPLIRNKISADNIFTARAPKFISNKQIQTIVDDLKEAGLLNSKREVMRTHGFRKWYANQCSRAHIDYPTREYLIGHKPPGQESSYNRMTEEDRVVEYIKAIPLLTIHSETRLKQQIQELKSERFQNSEEIYHKVMTELKQEYKLISKREWEMMKGEMKAIKEDILPEYYNFTGKPIHLDANYSDGEEYTDSE
ncbi:MAG: tyrosine-type recombinase/integrase [Nitrososphaeraceae archaeon]